MACTQTAPLPTIPENDVLMSSEDIFPSASTYTPKAAYHATPYQPFIKQQQDNKPPPRLIDIDPLLLSNLEIEVLLHLPLDTFPRPYLLQLAERAASHFIDSGRYPGWGASFDILNGPDGRVMGVNYRFDKCVCGGCPGKLEEGGWVGCSFPREMKRY